MNKSIHKNSEVMTALCKRFKVKRLEIFGEGVHSDEKKYAEEIGFIADFNYDGSWGGAESYYGLMRALEAIFGHEVGFFTPVALGNNPYLRRRVEKTRTLFYEESDSPPIRATAGYRASDARTRGQVPVVERNNIVKDKRDEIVAICKRRKIKRLDVIGHIIDCPTDDGLRDLHFVVELFDPNAKWDGWSSPYADLSEDLSDLFKEYAEHVLVAREEEIGVLPFDGALEDLREPLYAAV